MGYDEYKFSVFRARGFLFFAKAGTRIKERMLVCRPRVIYCEFPLHSDLENAWRLKRGNQLYLTSSFCDDPKHRLRSGAKGPYSRMDAEDLGGALEGSLWTVPKGTFFLHVALIEVQNISSIELSGPYTINGTDVVVDARPAAVQRPEETKLLEQLLDPAGPVRGLLAVDAAPDLWRLPVCVSDLVITCSRHAEFTFRGLRLVIEAWEKDWNDPWNKPWTPARHRFFPEKDKKMMETLLRCQSRDDCPVSLLPADALFAIFNLCGKKEGAEEEDEEDEDDEEEDEDDEEEEQEEDEKEDDEEEEQEEDDEEEDEKEDDEEEEQEKEDDEEEEQEEDEEEEDEEEEPAAKKAKH